MCVGLKRQIKRVGVWNHHTTFHFQTCFLFRFFSCFILLHRDTKQFILESENRSFKISNPHEFHRLAVMLHQVLWLFLTHVAAHVAVRTLWRHVSADCCDAIPLQNNRAPPTSRRGGSLLLALLRLLHHLSGTFRNKCHCLLFQIVVYQCLFRRKWELRIFFFNLILDILEELLDFSQCRSHPAFLLVHFERRASLCLFCESVWASNSCQV